MMRHFVKDRFSYLCFDFLGAVTVLADGLLIQGDAIGHHAGVTHRTSLREGNALVESVEVAPRRFVGHHDGEILNLRREFRRQRRESLSREFFKTLVGDFVHQSIVLVGTGL